VQFMKAWLLYAGALFQGCRCAVPWLQFMEGEGCSLWRAKGAVYEGLAPLCRCAVPRVQFMKAC
jgi:hypothetical protein